MQKKITKILLVFLFLILSYVVFNLNKSPQDSLHKFKYSTDLAEDQLIDPLLLCGDSVVPLVIDEIKDVNMPHRRYAIYFLGNGKYKEAICVLTSIFQNKNEADAIRGDALIAIYNIDAELGKLLANEVVGEYGYIGSTAKNISSDNYKPERRTRLDALLKIHN